MTETWTTPIPPKPADLDARTAQLHRALAERILVLDGATGTAMQDANLTAEDFGGPELEGCNENLCATRPDVVDRVHASYLEAGADIVETNTFGATPLVLDEYGLADQRLRAQRGRRPHRAAGLRALRHGRRSRASSAARWARRRGPSR